MEILLTSLGLKKSFKGSKQPTQTHPPIQNTEFNFPKSCILQNPIVVCYYSDYILFFAVKFVSRDEAEAPKKNTMQLTIWDT